MKLVLMLAQQVNVGLANDCQRLSRAVDARSVKRADVVDGFDVTGCEEGHVAAGDGESVVGLPALEIRFPRKIAQPANSGHHAGERGGNRGRSGVGKARVSVGVEVVYLGLEGLLGLRGGSAEDDPIAAAGDILNPEALRLEPGGELLNVVGAEAEAVGILLGCEPLVIERRVGILLLRQKLVERFPLAGRGHGEQRHIVELERRIDCAPIVLRLRPHWDARRKPDELAGDDGAGDAVRRGGEA